ncbi:uncharacterized protein LOC115525320 isoform X1 [Lynx canadensis]|uniref:uncharacterized protein LOC115525320 isoform X1 n=1 Tax=Lynx canadensis TaxID=61383 RepID=UPI0011B05049|nr:uncharacterized protein LOC115525320 isoform X1 [Lynx canadensis]
MGVGWGCVGQNHPSCPTLSRSMASTLSSCLTFCPHQYSSIHMPQMDTHSTWFDSMRCSLGIFFWTGRDVGFRLSHPRWRWVMWIGKRSPPLMSFLSHEQFIMSGSLTISCTRKQTEFLIEVSIGANIISTLLSSTGIILLSVNLVDIVLLECWELPACSLVKSFITNIVILQMILTCVQIFISFSLCGLTYTMDGKEISWASALSCLIRSHSEDPYQDLLTQPETYEDLVLQDIDQVHSHP